MAGGVNVASLAEQGYVTIDNAQIAVVLARQRDAMRRLRFGETVNPRLAEILSNIPKAGLTCDNARPIASWHQPFLDDSQKEAVRWALAAQDLFLIQGPPGTGKTSVISEIVLQILDRDPQARILLASQSNVAVNHAINKIVETRPELEPQAVRIGREEKAGIAEPLLLDRQMDRWTQAVLTNSDNYVTRCRSDAQRDPLPLSGVSQLDGTEKSEAVSAKSIVPELETSRDDWLRSAEIERMLEGWKQRVSKDRAGLSPTYLAQCAVIGATCIGVAGKGEVGQMDFDWVIVDEAGRATPPELLVPLIRGRRLVLVGDHKQLPPTIDRALEKAIASEGLDRRQFESSLFQDLWEAAPAMVKRSLDMQYRMHPSIGRMIAECFYGGSRNLQAGISPDERKHSLSWCPRPVVWYSTGKLANHHETAVGLSYRNELEVRAILKLLDRIHSSYVQQGISDKSIGLITGYLPQKNAIEQRVYSMREGWSHFSVVDVNTVDAYQGQERDIVIYSVVRSNKQGRIGFLKDFRRLNVALSRARDLVVVVGDPRVEHAVVRNYNPFYSVLQFLRANPSDALIMDFQL
jgi:serine/threonine-protein kinase